MTGVPGLASELLHGCLDLLFAPVCLGCGAAVSSGAAERRICGVCWSRARELPRPRCERCASPIPSAISPHLPPPACALCPTLPPSLRAVRSAFLFDGPTRRMVHALKYGGWHAAAPPMGRRMASVAFPLETEEEVRFVVPVPLGAARLRARGYNQAECLAREVALRRGWCCRSDLLLRARATDAQATLHADERLANVAGAFRASDAARNAVQGEHLLVVDDVWTTGATALACCHALLSAGARAVSVLTFARALPGPRH
jgi:ComF family protein